MGIEPTTSAWKAGGFTTKIHPHKMAVPTGIEPAISCVTGRHVNRYTTGPLTFEGLLHFKVNLTLLKYVKLNHFKKWRRKRDSNPACLPCSSVFKTDPFSRTWVFLRNLVEPSGIKPLTSCVQGRRSPS